MIKDIKDIKKLQLEARKNKDKFLAGILTTLLSEINIIGKNDGNRETTTEEALKVITKFKKGVVETIKIMRNSGGNARDIAPFYREIKIYDEFLPQMFDEPRLDNIISGIIITLDKPNIGSVMKVLKEQFNGQYDGKMASALIKAKV